ncbi:hypothetical protein HGI30_21860 [Paenibacillus albicereus]|uniref:Uncharacterized protein n=1 Tax=Paenibacillus albicereus TaxID=2726185 RepID=A0A6H2H3J4_9BACL|nr:hypothetical protein [Paenibacillus albicereus]QJC53908.1 hypothetical protein HGI30_21860 [Paenibacillus albicereus]
MEEYKKKPFITFSDAFNRATIGDWNALTKGSCLFRIITTLVIIGGLAALLYFK